MLTPAFERLLKAAFRSSYYPMSRSVLRHDRTASASLWCTSENLRDEGAPPALSLRVLLFRRTTSGKV